MFHWRQCASAVFDRALEILHDMANANNKSKRQLFPYIAILDLKH
jgi:hypothetical protein